MRLVNNSRCCAFMPLRDDIVGRRVFRFQGHGRRELVTGLPPLPPNVKATRGCRSLCLRCRIR